MHKEALLHLLVTVAIDKVQAALYKGHKGLKHECSGRRRREVRQGTKGGINLPRHASARVGDERAHDLLSMVAIVELQEEQAVQQGADTAYTANRAVNTQLCGRTHQGLGTRWVSTEGSVAPPPAANTLT